MIESYRDGDWIPSLPYRPLKKYSNGIYDPIRRVFYPFQVDGTAATEATWIPARKGYFIYVNTTTVSAYNQGDHAAGSCTITATQNGNSVYMGRVVCPATVAASNVNANASSNAIIENLMDSGIGIGVSISATGGGAIISFCYIPADPAGGYRVEKERFVPIEEILP